MRLSRKGRVVAATVIWVAVAAMLIVRGFGYCWAMIDSTGVRYAALAAALVIGGGKGFFVLSKSAARTAGFIRRRPERDWIWMSVHPVMWLLIPAMIGLGIGLRHWLLDDHPAVVLAVYVGVGVALLVAVRGFRAALRD